MQFLMLLVTLLLAIGVASLVIRMFRSPIDNIFARIIGEEISAAWRKFLTFSLFVVGVSSGVNIRKLEQFVAPPMDDMVKPELSPEYWGLELYRTIINTLGGMAWALLLFFLFALVAYVIVKRKEAKV